jgi:hypothetical protein
MDGEEDRILLEDELEEDDMGSIRQIFFQDIVPKLKRLDARLGTLNCEFAGKKYCHWTIRFESKGSGYDIVDFEYDEEGEGMDLDL